MAHSVKTRADDVDVPAQQVDARERQVARADHERDEEVAEHGGDRRDQEEEDHDDAVHGEELVVGVAADDVGLGRQQLEPDGAREQAAEHEHDRDRDQVEERDPLVVDGEEPRADAVVGVEVVDARLGACGAPWRDRPGASSRGSRRSRGSVFTYAMSCMTFSSLSRPW